MSFNDFINSMLNEWKGVYEITTGSVSEGIYGSKFTHALGSLNTLGCNPFAQLKLFSAGEPDASISTLFDLVLGIGTHVDFVYGKDVVYTFGGPHVQMSRGPALHLHTELAYGWGRTWPAIADDDPEEKSFSQDVKMSNHNMTRLVAALGQILNLVQSMLELWIRFKYEKINEYTGKLSLHGVDPCKELSALEKSASIIPTRLMAIIYHIELVNGLKNLGTRMLDLGKGVLKYGELVGTYLFKFIAYSLGIGVLIGVGVPLAFAAVALAIGAAVVIAILAGAAYGVIRFKDAIVKAWKNATKCVKILVVVLVIVALLAAAIVGTLAAVGVIK